MGVSSPWPLTVYQIAHVFHAVNGDQAQPALPVAATAPARSSAGAVAVPLVGGAVAGLLVWWLL